MLLFSLKGTVQGVGFRPFVARVATEMGLSGGVRNTFKGVDIILDLSPNDERVEMFLAKIKLNHPPRAKILEIKEQNPALSDLIYLQSQQGQGSFEILPSIQSIYNHHSFPPDLGICEKCIMEMFDKDNQRYLYPFTSCADCGPRYSILNSLPYDRKLTSMVHFEMCRSCENEFTSLPNRRFHVQGICCAQCGPQILLFEKLKSEKFNSTEMAFELKKLTPAPYEVKYIIAKIIDYLERGLVVALKGVGGFQLLVDPSNVAAVELLRRRKQRPVKAFALLCETISMIKKIGVLDKREAELLSSPARPLIFIDKELQALELFPNVAPRSRSWGVMLPNSGFQCLLMDQWNRPLIVTSANRDGEPMLTSESHDLIELQKLADFIVAHDLEILRPLDDSIRRVLGNKIQTIRLGRGLAPYILESQTSGESSSDSYRNEDTHLSVGLGTFGKTTIALSDRKQILVSQHLGDIDGLKVQSIYKKCLKDLFQIYKNCEGPLNYIYDDSISLLAINNDVSEGTIVAESFCRLPHHLGHLFAVEAEMKHLNQRLEDNRLVLTWDGIGEGENGELWGGEVWEVCGSATLTNGLPTIKRISHLGEILLIGGDRACREPRRIALFLIHDQSISSDSKLKGWCEEFKNNHFSNIELGIFNNLLMSGNQFVASSVGRLFDGVASLLNLCQDISFEGETGQILEFEAWKFAKENSFTGKHYEINLIYSQSKAWILEWKPLIYQILTDLVIGRDKGEISYKFHYALIHWVFELATKLRRGQVLVSGGCFQNMFLLEKMEAYLKDAGIELLWNEHLPPNDGGVSAGQAFWGQLKKVSKI